MEIELQNLEEIVVIPSQFKDEEKPPKFVFRTPNAADIIDRKSTRLNSSHSDRSRMPSSA